VSLHIADTAITSTVTGHTARRSGDAWSVTWLDSRELTRDQAVTALTAAELVAGGVLGQQHRRWPLLLALAAELHLTGDDAVYLIREKS
jgi:hypothetical protein